MAPPPVPAQTDLDDPIVRMSPDEWHTAVARELAELGMTYDELAEEAHRREFRSTQARMLWVIIGESQKRS